MRYHERLEAMRDAFAAVQVQVGAMNTLATRFGVSGRTMVRYVHHGQVPKVRRPALLRALVGAVDPRCIVQLAQALEVPEAEWPEALRTPREVASEATESPLRASLELSLFRAAEAHGVSPASARGVVRDVLAHVVGLRASAVDAHAVVSALASSGAVR